MKVQGSPENSPHSLPHIVTEAILDVLTLADPPVKFSHMSDLSNTLKSRIITQLCSANMDKEKDHSCCCFKPLNVGVVCYIAIDC